MAGAFLDQYDQMGRDGHHCVSEWFCADAPGSLRDDMVRWRDGGILSERLDAELQAYRRCCIDDTISESPHRGVKHHFTRAPASGVLHVASAIRLDQKPRRVAPSA